MKDLDLLPNFKVRAIVKGALRAYGVQANSPKLARRHALYVLKRDIDKNAIVQTVEAIR
jgi:hypothetical protein